MTPAERTRAWRLANPERSKAAIDAWHKAHPERSWRKTQPKQKVQAHRHDEYMRRQERAKAKAREWYWANREEVLTQRRAYRASHNERVNELNARRRAVKRAVAVEDVRRAVVWERDGGMCHLCRQPVEPKGWHLDHIVPLARGGEHSYANTAVSHKSCNLRKGAR